MKLLSLSLLIVSAGNAMPARRHPSVEPRASLVQEAGQADSSDLAKQTQNPVSVLISLPLQYNANLEVGSEENTQSVLNIQSPARRSHLGSESRRAASHLHGRCVGSRVMGHGLSKGEEVNRRAPLRA